MIFFLVSVHKILLREPTHFLQAMHAQTSVAAGLKSAGKAMSSMNKVNSLEY